MLDYAQRSGNGLAASVYSDGSPSISGLGLRGLMGRIAGWAAAPATDLPAFESGSEFPGRPIEAAADATLRARAQAAFRTVDGAADRALDAALAVMEAEIAQLRDVVRDYGEALKSVQTYASEDSVRQTARAALRARPQRLSAAGPIPKLTPGRPDQGRLRHGV